MILHDVFVVTQSFDMRIDGFVPFLQVKKRFCCEHVLASFVFYLKDEWLLFVQIRWHVRSWVALA